MDPFTEDFDIFFNQMSGSSSGVLGTSAKGTLPSFPVLRASRRICLSVVFRVP